MISKFTRITLIVVLISFYNLSKAQNKYRRCATMEAIEKEMQSNPALKADWEAKHKDLEAYIATHNQPKVESLNPSNPVIIPVVVHIVLPNPNIITDDDVEYVINALNRDFSGFNSDSTNGSTFISRRGHAAFKFVLARRTPAGLATTGIQRKVNANTQIQGSNPQPIKAAATGFAPWDITKYYNIFVGEMVDTTILGIAPYIGPGRQTGQGIDGVCINFRMFANNPCFTDATFNRARTAVHEIGHNLGLYHTFQGSNCANADFTTQLSSPGSALPASMLLASNDDTPPTSSPNYGCPGVGSNSACGQELMFQNYMDYSNDACLTMFTNNQMARMEYVIENFRAGWLTTQGHLPPVGTPFNEVGLTSIISPGGSERVGCNTRTYPTPSCGDILPKLSVTNNGVNDLTSITLNALINGVPGVSQTYTFAAIKPGKSISLVMPSQRLSNGTNNIKYFTSNPNGIVDSLPSNDTLSQSISVTINPVNPSSLPIVEGFENTAFNPSTSNWKVFNADSATITWARVANAGKTGTASARVNMFSYSSAVGQMDYLYSPQLNLNNTTDSVFISFDYAYRLRSTAANFVRDSLMVLVSDACSPEVATWTTLWKKGGSELRTNNTNIASNWTAVAADWTTTPVKINLDAFKNRPVFVAIATKNGGGQNVLVDNINIYSTPPLPLKLISFNAIQNKNNITCKWETKIEEGVKNYEIERSFDGKVFVKVGTVIANGNTTSSSYYQFVDEQSLSQNKPNIYYRLKMNDNDGKFTYSKIVFIKVGENQVVQIYPNPTKNNLNVRINSTRNNDENGTIQVVDYLGKIVLEKLVTIKNGSQTFELNTANLPSANYVVIIKNVDQLQTLKFAKN